MIEKIIAWAKKLPWWISWLFLLLLFPIFLFWMLKAQGKGKELAKAKHEKDVIDEKLKHSDELKRLNLAKEKLKELEEKEEELIRRKTETGKLMDILEKDQAEYQARISGVTSWDELQ